MTLHFHEQGEEHVQEEVPKMMVDDAIDGVDSLNVDVWGQNL